MDKPLPAIHGPRAPRLFDRPPAPEREDPPKGPAKGAINYVEIILRAGRAMSSDELTRLTGVTRTNVYLFFQRHSEWAAAQGITWEKRKGIGWIYHPPKRPTPHSPLPFAAG